MFTFKEFVSNSILLIEEKSMHLSHVEDVILEKGYAGAKAAIAYLQNVAGMLAGHSESSVLVTTKWDGSPAIFVGTNPENGKFFVGTKGIFSKRNPKICYTNKDIDELYGDKPDLTNKLYAALKYLPSLNIKDVILQGDIMFGPNEVKQTTMDGERVVTFMPNTIMYVVPSESKLGKTVKQAKFGIIFHTAYTGPNIHELEGSFNISLADLKPSKDVWYDDASYLDASGTVTMTAEETKQVTEQLNDASRLLATISKSDFDQLLSNKTYVQMLKQYQNQLIRNGSQIDNIQTWLEGLPQFIKQKIEKEKTKPETRQKKIDRLSDHTDNLQETLVKVLTFQKQMIAVKQLLIQKLEMAKTLDTFHVSDNKITVAKQEGFVAVDHLGQAVKLVDRLEFSKHNFARREDEEMSAVVNTGPIYPNNSYMGGETGLAGKDAPNNSYMGGETGLAGKDAPNNSYLGAPSDQFTNSTGTL